MNENLRRWLPWIIVAGIAAIVVIVIAINSGGDDTAADTTTTTSGETTTTTEAPEETTTTVAEETTTTAAPRPPGEALKLATLLPITGDLAAFGPGMENAVKLAIKEANAAGGVQGADLPLESFDTATSTDVAPVEADKIIASGAQAEIGAASSGISLSVIDALTEAEVTMVSPSNTSPQFTTYPHGGFYYRTAPSDALQGEFTARLLQVEGATDLAIIFRADSYGEGLNEVVANAFGADNIVAQEPYDPENLDAGTLMTAIAAANPASILCICFPVTGLAIHEAGIEEGLLGDEGVPWFYTDGMVEPGFQQDLADATGLDLSIISGWMGGFRGTAPGSEDTDAATAFAAAYMAEYGEEFSLFAPQSYDGAWLIILAAEASDGSKIGIKGQMINVSKGGEKCAGAECLALLQADPTTDIDYVGASGEIDFKENQTGDVGSAQFQLWSYTSDGGTETDAVIDNPADVS